MPNNNNHSTSYQPAFKRAAADFVERNGQSVEQSAAELGVEPANLREWTRQFGSRGKPFKTLSAVARLRAENEALRTQLLRLQVQWDILTSTLAACQV